MSEPMLKKPPDGKKIQIFISSTFIVTSILRFDEAGVSIVPIDLRWGITDTSNQSVLKCLSTVDDCRPFFVGLIGNRYGHIPKITKLEIEAARNTTAKLRNWLSRNLRNLSITEYEARYAALSDQIKSNISSRAGFFLRSPNFLDSVPKEALAVFKCENAEAEEKLESFRGDVRYSRFPVMEDYYCEFDVEEFRNSGKMKVKGLDSLEEAVFEFLEKGISEELQKEGQTDSKREKNEYLKFALSNAAQFYRREAFINSLKTQISYSRFTILSGPAGSGKTAVMSELVADYTKEGITVIPYFPMVSESPTLRDLLLYLLESLKSQKSDSLEIVNQIQEESEQEEGQGFRDVSSLVVMLNSQLRSLKEATYIVIDAINQVEFDDSEFGNQLDFVEATIQNENLFFITSAIAGDKCDLRAKQMKFSRFPMQAFSKKHSDNLVQSILQGYKKQLSPRQISAILAKEDSDKPLFLVTVCEELRVYGDFEKLTEYIQGMPGTIKGILEFAIRRLETDHGKLLVAQALSLICCSSAISLDELVGILNLDSSSKEWRSFKFDMLKYLQKKQYLEFFHQQLQFAAEERYNLGNVDESMVLHSLLLDHFLFKTEPEVSSSWLRGRGTRVDYSSLMMHVVKAHRWDVAFAIFSDLTFLEKCATLGLGYETLQWSDQLLKEVEDVHVPTAFTEASLFLRKNVHVLDKSPSQCFTKATQLERSNSVYIQAMEKWGKGIFSSAYLELLNISSEKEANIQTMQGHELPATNVAIHDLFFATCGRDGRIVVWDRQIGKSIVSIELSSKNKGSEGKPSMHVVPLSLAFSADGTSLFIGDSSGSVSLLDLATKRVVMAEKKCKSNVNALVFLKKQSVLLCGSSDGSFSVISPVSLKTLRRRIFSSGGVNYISASPDEDRVAIAVAKSVHVVEEQSNYTLTVSEHSTECLVTSVVLGKGNQLVFTSVDKSARLCSVSKGVKTIAVHHRLEGHLDSVLCADFSPDGELVVTSGKDNLMKFWGMDGGLQGELAGPTGTVYEIFFLDPERVITISYDRRLCIWSVKAARSSIMGHKMRLLCSDFSPGDSLLATGSRDRTLKIWSAVTYQLKAILTGHTDNVLSCRFHPVQDYLASGGRDSKVIIWDTRSFQVKHVLLGHKEKVNSVDFTTLDGSTLATGSSDKTIIIWKNFAIEKKLYGHRDEVTGVRFIPDLDRLLSSSSDGTVKLWDTKTGSKLGTFRAGDVRLSCVDVSPIDPWLVAGSKRGRVYFFSLVDGRLIAQLKSHNLNITSVRVTRNNAGVISCSTDSSVQVLEIDSKLHEKMEDKAANSNVMRKIRRAKGEIPRKPAIRLAASYVATGRLTCLSRMSIGDTLAVGEGAGKLFFLRPRGFDIT